MDGDEFLFKYVFPEGIARQDAVAFAIELGDAKASETEMREYDAMLFYSPEKRDAFLAQVTAFFMSRDVNRMVNDDVARFDLTPELPKFRFPTLVLTGRYDMNVAASVAYGIHGRIPGSQFVVFERSGHLPFCEEPDAFLRTVQGFLTPKP